MAVAPGTGNHKGCPYDGRNHGGRRERATTRVRRVPEPIFIAGLPMVGAGNGQPQGLPLRRVCRSLFSWLAPGTGNHKGCPYNGFAGAYFHGWRRERATTRVAPTTGLPEPIFIANPPLPTNADPIFMIRGAGGNRHGRSPCAGVAQMVYWAGDVWYTALRIT